MRHQQQEQFLLKHRHDTKHNVVILTDIFKPTKEQLIEVQTFSLQFTLKLTLR